MLSGAEDQWSNCKVHPETPEDLVKTQTIDEWPHILYFLKTTFDGTLDKDRLWSMVPVACCFTDEHFINDMEHFSVKDVSSEVED